MKSNLIQEFAKYFFTPIASHLTRTSIVNKIVKARFKYSITYFRVISDSIVTSSNA